MVEGKKIYFASDFHLGVPTYESSRERELLLVKWLEMVKKDAQEIYLVGDIFDFWFEYKHVAPKGYVRLLGKIAEITDSGIPVKVFTGNHDMWLFDYLPKELGIELYREPITKTYGASKFFIGHGDGLGPGDRTYKFIKWFFANPACQWLFARIHPNLGFGVANFWSRNSRAKNVKKDEIYKGDDKEFLYQFCLSELEKEHYDFFVFGHRHLLLDKKVGGSNARYINLGEWVTGNPHYGVFDGTTFELKSFS